MPNFSIALTGLQSDTVALNTIGNNLANLNTTAFKTQTTSFEDLFYQRIGTSGSADPLQVGVGTRVSATTSSFQQGSLNSSQKTTDMALSGAGFFLVQRGNVQSLTRAGDFQTDNQGNLITVDGENVMGYGVKNGAVNQNGGLVPIQIPLGATEAAQATTNIALTSTLDASAAVGSQLSSPVRIFDSLGAEHDSTVTYTKTSATTWNYAINLPATDSAATATGNTGTLTFDSSGHLMSPTANVAGAKFSGLSDGAADLNINFNLYSSSGAPLVTQTSGTSSTNSTFQDGFTAGAYQSFTVDGSGTITATFDNNHTTVIGQVAVATVANTDGLARSGGNDFTVTAASGLVSVGAAGVGGRALIVDSELEGSNVDISAEFSNLIVAQRAFEANSKTVTTFDSVTENAINMIR